MLNIKHILFPVDFSERCSAAVPFVESIATRYRARVTLLNAIEPYYGAMGEPGGGVTPDPEEMLRAHKARLDSALTRDFAHLQVERVVAIGDPAEVIAAFAHRHEVDLIMMPTHGYGPFRTLLLGSVTAKVLHDAKCPVWTAAHVEEPPSRDHIAFRNILCAVDGTASSVGLMTWAGELAADANATLRLVHVIPGLENAVARKMNREYDTEVSEEERKTLERLEESAGIAAPLCVTVGNVAERVHEEARRHGADLVVIGRGALHETLGRLRTHAHAIIRQSLCPVVSV